MLERILINGFFEEKSLLDFQEIMSITPKEGVVVQTPLVILQLSWKYIVCEAETGKIDT